MYVSENLGVNERGHLTFGGLDTLALAKEYGTPLYLMDEDLIRKNCRALLDAFGKYYDGNANVSYASKALSCVAICKIMAEEGMHLDVVSGGELFTALRAGFPAERIHFHGNNKTEEELRFGLDSKIDCFVVDNLYELERLEAIAAEQDQQVRIYFRIKPGVDAHTHSFIRTGQIDSKFGLALENGEAEEAVARALQCRHLTLAGLHCHIGSQIFDMEPFAHAAQIMIAFLAQIRRQHGVTLGELNLGGGFGIRYLPEDDPVELDECIRLLTQAVKAACDAEGFPLPRLGIEPGRSIVGPAGITLYTVGAIKEIKGIRTYVAVDGGMADNPRYALYQSPYTLAIADRAGDPRDFKATVVGRCCESGDILQEHTMIQAPRPGDVLAVLATGAYNYSMSSNYNRIPRPAMVLVSQGRARVAVRRETYEDLLRNDCE